MNDICDAQSKITWTEMRILNLIQQGLTNREIAAALSRSEFTVKTHVQRILAKTGSRNRAHACLFLKRRQAEGLHP